MPSPSMGLTTFLRRVGGYLRPYRMQVAVIVLGLVLDLVFDTAFRLSFKFLIDDVLVQQDWRLMVTILCALGGGVVVVSLLAVGRDYLYARVSTRVLNDLRARTFEHLQRLSVGFYSRTQAGEVMARFTTDLSSVESALVLALPGVLMSVLGFVLAAVPLFALEWHLALLAIIGLPVCLIGPRLLEEPASEAAYRLKEEQARLTSVVQENVGAQAVVKAFGLQASMVSQFRHQIAALYGAGVRSSFLSYLMERTPNIATLVLELLVVGTGAYLAFTGRITVGSLVSFYILFVSVSQSITGVTWVVPYLIQAAAGLQRVEELLAEEPQVADAPDAVALPRLGHGITFRDVSFAYSAESTVLQHLDLEITQGSAVAFVGPSGSGKSTVLSLVLRFYDPSSGTVAFDGHNLRQATQESLRAQVGVVFQESFLFNTTIRENIRMGRRGATDAEVEQAGRAAEIHELVVRLPEGYDTLVGERGGHLSGGQRQRVALARAILRDPAILVLDEATSALDPHTEAAIHATLERLAHGRTVICVTHRLSTVVNMDRIFVLQNGSLVERGTHRELLNLKGVYQGMWRDFTLELTQDALVGEVADAQAEAAQARQDLGEELAQHVRQLQEELQRQVQEVARLQRINQRWAHLAGTDRLTGLPNKISFLQAVLPQEVQQAQRGGTPISFMLISGDNLGPINESHGRDAGDQVLRELARFLQGFLRGEEHLGHIDGTHFAVAMHPATLEQARARAEELRQQVAAHDLPCGDTHVRIGISVGVAAASTTQDEDAREVVERAFRELNQALYVAKRGGGNRVCVADDAGQGGQARHDTH